MVASVVTLAIDSNIGSDWFADHLWAYANQPEGARAVLSTIAGSMITVAGVTFSMTIASVSYAAGQLGPRLLTNFMRDRGNQWTLGTFIATFLYALMILRTVRAGSPSGSEQDIDAFVPQISVLVALLLAVASVAVLIFFIHHIPESINAQNITARIGRDLVGGVERRFPGRFGEAADEVEEAPEPHADRDRLPAAFGEQARVIGAAESGYIRSVDHKSLLGLATKEDLVVRLVRRPGDFVTEGQPLMEVWPPERFDETQTATDAEDGPETGASGAVDEARALVGRGSLTARCRGMFSLGPEKTQHQNLLFLVDELVEIAARAVSPGINDPFTAITAIDWLGSGLTTLGTREPLDPHRLDGRGVLRVVAEPVSFEQALQRTCDQLRPYVAADRNAGLHLLKTLGQLAFAVDSADRRRLVLEQAGLLADATDLCLQLPVDRKAVRDRLIALQAAAGSALPPA